MEDLEDALRGEVRDWQEKARVQEKAQAQKSRINLFLAAVLGSSLLAAGAAEVGQIIGGEYQEDVKRCEIALNAIEKLTSSDLTGFSEVQVARIREEVVEMMDANCHIDPE